MKGLPPLKSLQFFLVAGHAKNFKEAAEQLYVTQAAVSQQIRLLEESLQQKLFERSNRQTVLTDKGRQLLPFIEKAFDELSAGVKVVTGDQSPQVLRISTTHSFTSIWLISRIQAFQKIHPEIKVQLDLSTEIIDFKKSGIDLAIRLGREVVSELVQKKMYDDTLTFVASPKLLAGVNKNNTEQIFRLPWLEDTSGGLKEKFQEYCQGVNISYDSLVPVMQTHDALPLIDSAIQGQGFLLTNTSLVIEHIRAGRLVKLLEYTDKSPYTLYLVAPQQQFLWNKVKLFEEWITPKLHESFSDLNIT